MGIANNLINELYQIPAIYNEVQRINMISALRELSVNLGKWRDTPQIKLTRDRSE